LVALGARRPAAESDAWQFFSEDLISALRYRLAVAVTDSSDAC
jgi:hypothetical protein